MTALASRSGRFVKQPAGYRAFIPASLPPEPTLRLDLPMVLLLSRADQALGRLDGVARTLPNLDLFVAMYVRREAVLSSQIEGTRSTLEHVLTFELDAQSREVPTDVREVVGYVRAMDYGLDRLSTLPLSLRLIREIHGELFRGFGREKDPGEFRRTQNWIGVAGATLSQAIFVPPPPPDMHRALDNFEKFLHEREALPALIHCGLVHAQFEMIHPFLDGNGRAGRLLITLLLCERGILRRPMLYLSHYLRRHRAEYYDRLTAIHQSGDWEGWLTFFLRGVAETADEASRTASRILDLREEHRALVPRGLGANGPRLLDLLFERPLLNVNLVKEVLGVSYFTANKLVDHFEQLGLLEETTGWQRNRRYRYAPYLALFEEQGGDEPDGAPARMAESKPRVP
jgi:Fic family protein